MAVPSVPGLSQWDARTGSLPLVCVAEECRGRGLGSSLVGLVVEEARLAGWAKITVNSLETAVGFYKKQGFREPEAREANGSCYMTLRLEPGEEPHTEDKK